MPFGGENKREKILVLMTLCFALFMAMLDNTVVNVALPTLARKLGAGVSELQWIVDSYVLAFASLLLTGGILGDRFGRKRMFLTGLVTFTAASLLCGLSGSTTQLIAFRALQGIGGSLLIPGTLSILTVTFPPHERAQAIGIWAGVSGIALALGPTLGGWMVENIGWQSIFFLNVPIGVVGFMVALRTVRESRAEHARSLDVPGLLLGTGMLFSVTYGLIEANQKGWTNPVIVGSLVLAATLLAAFLLWEHRNPHAMMPLSFFRIPAFSAGNFVAFSVSLGMFGTFFFMSLYLQLIRGYTALQTGARFLPMTAMIIVTAPIAGKVAQRFGSRWPLTFGLTLAGTGLMLASRMQTTTPYGLMVPVFMILGIGMGASMTPMTAAVMNAVGHQRAGLGSAMTNTSREVGGVFGIALLGTLLTTKLKSSLTRALAGVALTATQRTTIIETAGHGRFDANVLLDLPAQPFMAVRQALGASFLDGFRLSLMVASVTLFFAAAVANRFIPAGTPAPAETDADEAPVPAH